MLSIYPIVEGHGEVIAVPILLRRFAHEVFETYEFQVLQPFRLSKGKMTAGSHLENAATLARQKLEQFDGDHAILVIRDADDDCPGHDAPTLLEWVTPIVSPIPVSVVFAKAEYEAWFLAAVRSLCGYRGIADNATVPADPEAIRGAKEHLERHCMMLGATYSPTVDQPALTGRFSFDEAQQNCPSFDKLWRDLERLFQQGAQ